MTDVQLSHNASMKNGLLESNEAFRALVTEHHQIDERVRHLSGLTHLTSQQEYEEASLKKQKLALKDRIEAIMRGRPLGTSH